MKKTREQRRDELKQLAAMPNGINKLYLILNRTFIPFEKVPIGTLMIEAILGHEYPLSGGAWMVGGGLHGGRQH